MGAASIVQGGILAGCAAQAGIQRGYMTIELGCKKKIINQSLTIMQPIALECIVYFH